MGQFRPPAGLTIEGIFTAWGETTWNPFQYCRRRIHKNAKQHRIDDQQNKNDRGSFPLYKPDPEKERRDTLPSLSRTMQKHTQPDPEGML